MADNNNNSQNVSVGKPMSTGAVYFNKLGQDLPTDAITKLADAWSCAGYISEDGVTNEVEVDSEDIKAWGGDVVASPMTSHSEKFGMTFIECNATTLKQVYGEKNVTIDTDTGAIAIKHTSDEHSNISMVIEVVLSGDRVKRLVIPNAKLSELGEIAYKDDEAIGYECTFSAFPDQSGVKVHEYICATSTGE